MSLLDQVITEVVNNNILKILLISPSLNPSDVKQLSVILGKVSKKNTKKKQIFPKN